MDLGDVQDVNDGHISDRNDIRAFGAIAFLLYVALNYNAGAQSYR